ncbi:MAG: class I SAM-dependent methyltransferase [Planctomycetes bacterium]|nr:class I SAM-dependent methyltransferase [Planctomycetota bacterium]
MQRLDDCFSLSKRDEACELCGGGEFQLVGCKDRRGQPLTTVLCTTCGLISHEALPTDAELDAYYSRQYRIDYHGEFLPSPRRVLRAWGVGQSILQRLRPFVRERDRILEIGAGIGCTVKSFEMAGYDAQGIEPHHGFQEFARKHLGARVTRCTLADLPDREKFDVVLLVHVIEHFNHPRRELRRIVRLLNPGGRLYVECPNAEAPHAAPGKMFHFAHVYNFTNRTLAMLAKANGLACQAMVFEPHHPLIGQVYRMSSSIGTEIDSDSYSRSVAALTRYNTLTYHARPAYLADRLRRAGVHVGERLFARWRLSKLLARLHAAELRHPANVRRVA